MQSRRVNITVNPSYPQLSFHARHDRDADDEIPAAMLAVEIKSYSVHRG